MGAQTILDLLKAKFDALSVTGGGATFAFAWHEWEVRAESRGACVFAQASEDTLRVTDIGGGAQRGTELIELEFRWPTTPKAAIWTQFKDALKVAVLARVRMNERDTGVAWWTEVIDVSFGQVEVVAAGARQGTHGLVYANTATFLIRSKRDDVYGP